LLVPPTISKGQHHKTFELVWEQAARALAEADSILVFGYSLPESDQFFRYLFGVTRIQAWLKRFWVFDPDPSGNVEARFRTLLGADAGRKLKVFKEPFSSAIAILGKKDVQAELEWAS